MKKPTFFKSFLSVLVSFVALASTPKPAFAQRGGGGFRGSGGFRSGGMGGFRGGFRGGAPARMWGGPSWHSGGSGFAPHGRAFGRDSFRMDGGRAGMARPPIRFDRQAQDGNRPPSARFSRDVLNGNRPPMPFESRVQDSNRPPMQFERPVQNSNRPPSAGFEPQVQGSDSSRAAPHLASPRAQDPGEMHSSRPNSGSPATITRNTQDTGMLPQSRSRSANASGSVASLSVISTSQGDAKFSHFGTSGFRTSASSITSTRFNTNTSLFTGARFASPFENRFGSITFGRAGFVGAGFNRFDPNVPHVFNSTFRFNEFGFNRFAFNNFFFFDRFFFFNRFGFFPARNFLFFPRRNFFFFDFAFFPGFGFFGAPWWWGPGWWDPSWGWEWPSPPLSAWGSSVYNPNLALSGSASSTNTENPSTDRNESERSPNTNPTSVSAPASPPSILLYLKDGTMRRASDYWFADGKLHFILNGGERTIAMDELDLQPTVDENAKRGVPFTLKQKPKDSNTKPNKSDKSPDDSPSGITGSDQHPLGPAMTSAPSHPPVPPIEYASQP